MRKRRSLSRKKSKSNFRRGSGRNKLNRSKGVGIKRGGYRL